MNTERPKLETGGRQTRRVVDCGGRAGAATSLSPASRFTNQCQPSPAQKLRRLCAPFFALLRPSKLATQSNIWRHFPAVLPLSTIAFQLSTSPTHAQYAITWSTIDGGGGTSTGSVYSVSGTIGQPDAGGPLTNGQYSITGGFWALPTAVQVTDAPTLTLAPATPGNATISWTPNTPGFVLQETLSLSPTNWVNSVSGATNPVIVPATLPTKFYRLFKP